MDLENVTLEEYKKQVQDYLKKNYNCTTEEIKSWTHNNDKSYELCLKDKLTPQEMAEGLLMGLL